ncbi:hypothetical protein CPAR01_13097 [Colletotrichum paranaense]|uniref:Uncharacterized protein n=1 Tax=Colletotrichum paranaense TaxID=1914294 RepID=A0ABQ9S506_9PEZI|nr:uncharacterized protein CPAR01_13097 [Colletotrichum paranaense]KAK1526569.1 hypothetical protein CPAR01_13097 [Colletotrichum paranaense]
MRWSRRATISPQHTTLALQPSSRISRNIGCDMTRRRPMLVSLADKRMSSRRKRGPRRWRTRLEYGNTVYAEVAKPTAKRRGGRWNPRQTTRKSPIIGP